MQTTAQDVQRPDSNVATPDGRQIASGCFDRTVKLWDVKTGHVQKTLEEHSKVFNR